MRGEFIRGDGLVLPNNVTRFGAGLILGMAFREEAPLYPLELGLCNGVFTPELWVNQLERPSGLNGYAPQAIPATALNWPGAGYVAGEAYVESKACVFVPINAGFDLAITRLYVGRGSAEVIALSSPLPAPLRITPSTPVADRTFRYRLYLR